MLAMQSTFFGKKSEQGAKLDRMGKEIGDLILEIGEEDWIGLDCDEKIIIF